MTKERDTFRKAIVLSSLERVYLVLKAFMCDNYRYVYIEIYIYMNHFVQIFEVTCARDSCGENAINFNNYTYHDGNFYQRHKVLNISRMESFKPGSYQVDL